MDATRISDGKRVILKSLSTTNHPDEIPVHRFLTSDPLASDPKNHTAQLYEVLPDPRLSTRAIIVLPLLLPFDYVPFRTVGEALDMMHQTIEVSFGSCGFWTIADSADQGLQFMHQNGVAHRCAIGYTVVFIILTRNIGIAANRTS